MHPLSLRHPLSTRPPRSDAVVYFRKRNPMVFRKEPTPI